MAQRLNNLNEIISVLKSGSDFYRRASRKSDRQDRSRLFEEHAALREDVARALSQVIEDVGGEVKDTHPREEFARVATAASALVGDTEDRLVSGLEEHEDRTLAAFRRAIHHPDNACDEVMLKDYMAKFQETHDRMRDIKHGDTDQDAATE